MPIYEYQCGTCKTSMDVHKTMANVSREEACPSGCGQMGRIYSFGRTKEFETFYDEQYKCTISSARQEARLMRAHGHIDARDTPQRERFRDKIRSKQRKPVYSIPKGG